ncbi:MAG: class I SAM-dependent methyltransferase [Vulcanimicrobiaceae bacterium]
MDALALRERMVSRLKAAGTIRSPAVERALRAVPRHAFIPNVPMEEAYADGVVFVKAHAGLTISSASQPTMIALMLEQLEVAPGSRILEIGTGSGYNAALLAHLTGPNGFVTTVELEADLAGAAQRALALFGTANVRVVTGDGSGGYPGDGPYDREIVTACALDIAPAWWEQLRDGGRLVVPLALDQVQRSIAFERDGSLLRSASVIDCAFVALRGSAAQTPHAAGDRAMAIASGTMHVAAMRRNAIDPAVLARAEIVVERAATIFAIGSRRA